MSVYVHRKEEIYFILLLLVTIPMYLLFIFTGVGLLILLPFILIPLIAHWINTGIIRGNGVKVTEKQFPEIHARVKEIAEVMQVKKLPDVFIVQRDGMLNAFATRFFGKNMVTLYSGIADLHVNGAQKELDFVIAHELAHVKRNHVMKNFLVLFGNWIPFLGSAYSRACEYTCDAMAHACTEDLEASKRALTILAAGPELYKHVNEEAYLEDSSREKHFFVWFSEKISTHPVLPKRIFRLNQVFGGTNPAVSFKTTALFKAGLAGAFVLVLILGAGGAVLISFLSTTSLYSDFVLDSEGTTELMAAASENDYDQARELIEQGEDVNVQDESGMTALMYAVYATYDLEFEEEAESYDEMIALLLENGVDPDLMSDEGDIATVDIISLGNIDLANLLIEKGADIHQEDGYGQTPLTMAVHQEDSDMVQLLIDAGADPFYVTSENESAQSIAEDADLTEITALLYQ
ncbi:M48 family metallopeptidase [Bacillus sp. FSL H8-0547]